ncbi:MAG TPA: translation initiation factor IF-3 [Bacteriovoracaceae bacterium]|nr:translation initiation factor IF-3 [Bacteriovoracaceae bacterium]
MKGFGSSHSRGRNSGPRVNHEIRIPECRLVGDDGHQYGIVSMSEALRIAEGQGLDLVEISPTATPPLVKVIDYGKFKYEAQKKANEAKQKQLVVQLKEIQLKPNIEKHDLETKLNHAKKFLEDGDKIKMVMQFRGREMAYKDAGMEKFKSILVSVVEMGAVVEQEPLMQGNRIITILAPDKQIVKMAQQRARELAQKKAEEKAARREGKLKNNNE